ncbi:unnamed protein product [Rotaria sordida]|uniref:Uncharacterized protein n=1 Tax=Rotaria sordida TaxID=392033 RepID=A0A814T2X4_9BILA|nr:unnamed protein product [Rotaria sordida]
MKANLFCLIYLIFCNETHRVSALECYFCLSTNVGTTGCQDKFNNNGTSISRVGSRDSDAICTKMIGKLSNGHKFTVRNVSSTGCPQDLESSVVVGNDTTVRISDLEIYCCNKKLCNQAINRYHIQSNILILSVFIINSIQTIPMSVFQRLFGRSNKEDANQISSNEAIQRLSNVEEILSKKQEHFESQIEVEKGNALLYSRQGNKRAALMALKRKKKYEKALIQIDGTLTTLEIQRETLQNASSNMEILHAMRQAAGALKKANQNLDVDDVHILKEELIEQQQIADEIANVLSTQPSGISDLYNDDDLERELNELAKEDTPEITSLPDVPTTNKIKQQQNDLSRELEPEIL